MAELLGIGCTHGPHLQFPDEHMADILRRHLENPNTPDAQRDPKCWPAAMRQEWGDDEGLSAARRHRATLVEGFRRARQALDAFAPDFVLVWGDDQYENFKEDLVPPFGVYALDEVPMEPYKPSPMVGTKENVWGQPPDAHLTLKGHQEAGAYLAAALIDEGFDVTCSYKLLHATTANHAFVRTAVYLDYDQAGAGFPYPLLPFHVNCYGSNLWDNVRGGQRPDAPAPPSPKPWRCYDLGRAVARVLRQSPWRVALVGSSSWSHAFLTAKNGYLFPDVESDRRRLEDIRAGRLAAWRDLTADEIHDNGQHEMLNWICLAGAMEGRRAEVLAFAETYLFSSCKAVVLFPV